MKDVSEAVPVELDRPAVAASPPLLEQMALAGLMSANALQRVQTNRNDQPGAANNLIFFFLLSAALTESTATLQLTAPDFFVFAEDCLEGFVVNEDVFGGQGFVNGLSPFPSDVVVQECIGNHEVALAQLRPAKMPLATYAFRIRVQNPPNTPTLNTWSLTVASEASELFDSFDLWQIQDGTFLSSSVPAFGNSQEVFQSCSFTPASEMNTPLVIAFSGQKCLPTVACRSSLRLEVASTDLLRLWPSWNGFALRCRWKYVLCVAPCGQHPQCASCK